MEASSSDIEAQRDILKMVKHKIDFETSFGKILTKKYEVESRGNETAWNQKTRAIDFDEGLFKRFEALGRLDLPAVPEMELGQKLKPRLFATALEQGDTDTWCC